MSATSPTSTPPPPSEDASPPSNSSPPPQASPPSNPSPPQASPPSNPSSPPTSPPTSPPSSPPTSPPASPPSKPPASPPQAPPPAPVSPPPASPPPQSPPPTAPPPESPPPPNSTPPPPSSPSPPPSNRSPPPPSVLRPPPPSVPRSPPPSVPRSPSPSVPPPGTPLLSPPPPPPQSTSSSSGSTGLIAGIAVGSVIGVALLLGLVLFLYFRKRPGRRDHPYVGHFPPGSPSDPYRPGQLQSPLVYSLPPPPSSPSWRLNNSGGSGSGSGPNPSHSPKTPVPPPAVAGGSFKYEDLALATNGFAESNVLGQGGFGLVYRGTLSGKEVAIKKLKSGGGQGDREFRAEVDIISRVHHRNLVSLVGSCVHEDQRLLVYEYVPNKTLDFHLHGSGRPTLDWLRRWKIALGSAKGLAYLHEDCEPKIIHRDIKAANILLDYNFEPKVADFGLAKFVPTNMSHVSTRVMGTFGYVAPEYAQSGKLTDRSDVYSFGVMLLELITGRKPIMASDPQMEQSLVNWARPLLSKVATGDISDELIDPWLETNYDQYDMTRLIQCAAAAVRHSARMRPRMGQIVRYLEGEIALEDLNAGMMPGDSKVKGNSTEQEVLRRMAFDGILSEDLAESDQTSDYELASSSGANTEEIEQRRLNKIEQSSEV